MNRPFVLAVLAASFPRLRWGVALAPGETR